LDFIEIRRVLINKRNLLSNPAQLRVPRQDEANVQVFVRPSIDAFEGEPGLSPDLRLLHLHPTLLNPRWPKDSMRTLTLTLPPLNPFASRHHHKEDIILLPVDWGLSLPRVPKNLVPKIPFTSNYIFKKHSSGKGRRQSLSESSCLLHESRTNIIVMNTHMDHLPYTKNPQFNHGSGWDVSRRCPDDRDAERVHVVLSRGGRLDQSRSCFARDRDPSFTRAPMLTGAPNNGRLAQLASELKAEGR
jgi:hypothetical protein